MKLPTPKQFGLFAAGYLIPMLAARLTRNVAGKSYSLITKEVAPKNPAHPMVTWKQALIWSVVSGSIGGISRMVARKGLAGTFIPVDGDGQDQRLNEIDTTEV